MRLNNIIFDNSFIVKWVISNFLGFILGMIVAIILSYSILNLFHPEETNMLLGLGYGLGIGFVQWYLLNRIFKLSKLWILMSALGIGIPYAGIILLMESGFIFHPILGVKDFYIGFIFFMSGLLVGFLQMILLKPKFSRSYYWIIVSCLAWGIALSLNSILFSGIIMGIISLLSLIWGIKYKNNQL